MRDTGDAILTSTDQKVHFSPRGRAWSAEQFVDVGVTVRNADASRPRTSFGDFARRAHAFDPAETFLSLDGCLSMPVISLFLGPFLVDLVTSPALLPRDAQRQAVTISVQVDSNATARRWYSNESKGCVER